jgi:hypothetical protein
LDECNINTLIFENCSFFKEIEFPDCFLKQNLSFRNCSYPQYIDFSKFKIEGTVELGLPSKEQKPVLKIDSNFPFNKVKFNRSYFDIEFVNVSDESKRQYVYRGILEQQKIYGSEEDIAAADIALKDELVNQGNFVLWIQKFL